MDEGEPGREAKRAGEAKPPSAIGGLSAGTRQPVAEPEAEGQLILAPLSQGEWQLDARHGHLLALRAGRGILEFAERETPVIAPCVIWLPPQHAARLRLEAGARGALGSFTDFAIAHALPLGGIAKPVRDAIRHPLIGSNMARAKAEHAAGVLEAMVAELQENLPGNRDVARYSLGILLVLLWRFLKPSTLDTQPSPRSIVQGFIHLVEMHSREHWSVARYARHLGVTSDRLNSAVRRATGRSPLAVIHARLLAEATMMLDGTNLQVSEIAEALGFRDAAYFNRFFKRMTGETPGRFRARASLRPVIGNQAFYAWP